MIHYQAHGVTLHHGDALMRCVTIEREAGDPHPTLFDTEGDAS